MFFFVKLQGNCLKKNEFPKIFKELTYQHDSAVWQFITRVIVFSRAVSFFLEQHEPLLPTTNRTDRVRSSISSQTNKLYCKTRKNPQLCKICSGLFSCLECPLNTPFFLLSNKEVAWANVPGEWNRGAWIQLSQRFSSWHQEREDVLCQVLP